VRARGFTLLEVMVAMAVFAVAGLAVMKSAGEQVLGLGLLEEKTFANWVANNQLVQLRLERRWPGPAWTQGQETLAGHTWHWRWHGVETGDDRFRALDVEVRAQSEDASPRASLRTYVAR